MLRKSFRYAERDDTVKTLWWEKQSSGTWTTCHSGIMKHIYWKGWEDSLGEQRDHIHGRYVLHSKPNRSLRPKLGLSFPKIFIRNTVSYTTFYCPLLEASSFFPFPQLFEFLIPKLLRSLREIYWNLLAIVLFWSIISPSHINGNHITSIPLASKCLHAVSCLFNTLFSYHSERIKQIRTMFRLIIIRSLTCDKFLTNFLRSVGFGQPRQHHHEKWIIALFLGRIFFFGSHLPFIRNFILLHMVDWMHSSVQQSIITTGIYWILAPSLTVLGCLGY